MSDEPVIQCEACGRDVDPEDDVVHLEHWHHEETFRTDSYSKGFTAIFHADCAPPESDEWRRPNS